MKKTEVIKKNYEFKYFFKKGTYIPGKLLEIFIYQNNKEKNRIGIVVSKKVGGSVTRNKIKRYIRAAYTDIEKEIIKNSNILIIWKKKETPEKANFFDIKKDLQKIFKKADILGENNEKNSNFLDKSL